MSAGDKVYKGWIPAITAARELAKKLDAPVYLSPFRAYRWRLTHIKDKYHNRTEIHKKDD